MAWLDAHPQLGRDVFARGGALATHALVERTADLPALLRTYAHLMGPLLQQTTDDIYRHRPPLLWRVPDALPRMGRLLPELLGAGSESASLWRFLPGAATLEAVGLARSRSGLLASRAMGSVSRTRCAAKARSAGRPGGDLPLD